MTSSVRRGGYEPLPEMGEYVCDCYEHGTGEPWAHVGSSHVHERVVRCRDCYWCAESAAGAGALECDYINRGVDPDGFCAWGVERGEE